MVEQPILVQTLLLLEAACQPRAARSSEADYTTSAAGILAPSPDGRYLGLVEPGGQALHLLSSANDFHQLSGTFKPAKNLHSRGRDQLSWVAWNAESALLAVGSSSGAAVILDCSCHVHQAWQNTEPWARAGVAGLCFGPGDQLLVLTHDAQLYSLSCSSGKQLFTASLKGWHITPKAVAYQEGTGLLVIAGDGGEAGVSVSGWKLRSSGMEIVFPTAKPRLRGRRQRYAGPSGWSMAFSPTGSHLAIAAKPGRLVVFDLAQHAETDTFLKFGGRKDVEYCRKLQYYVKDAASAIDSVAWWDPRHLVTLDTEGVVAIAALPGYLSVLGDMPEQLVPGGTAVAVASHGKERGLFVMVPLLDDSGAPGWRLGMLAQRTPEQMVQLHAQEGNWALAQELAQEFNVKLDMLYRNQWLAGPVCEDSIQSSLARMEDRKWVVQECLSRVAGDYGNQLELLQYGLNETAVHLSHALDKMNKRRQWEGEEPRWFAGKRLQLLKYIDRLNTYNDFTHRQFSSEGYAAFRDADLVAVAMTLAELANASAVQALVQRHPAAVQPSLLVVLSSFPETLDPREYSPLLPLATGQPSCECAAVRPADWIECTDVMAALEAHGAHSALLECTEEMLRLRYGTGDGMPVPTPAQVEQWYVSRALEIDRTTGQLPNAATLLELAVQKGVDGATRKLLAAAQNLQAMLLSCTQLEGGCGGLSDITLERFAALDEQAQLRLVLQDSSEHTLESDITRMLVPLLSLLPEASAYRLRQALIAAEINSRPSWCERLVQLECGHLRIFPDSLSLAQAVLAGAADCSLPDAWGVLESILLDVGSLLQGEAGGPDAEPAELLQQQVQGQLQLVKAGRILAKYGGPLPPPAMRSASKDFIQLHMQKMLLRLPRAVTAQWGEAQWVALWRELREIQATVWAGRLHDRVLLSLFASAAMEAGRIGFAASYLKGAAGIPISNNAIKLVSLVVGNRLLDTATALDHPNLPQALQCFQVAAPFSEDCWDKAQTVQGMLQLAAWGVVDVAPAAVRRGGAALPLIARVLAAQPERAYKHLRDLLQIAGLLGMDKPHHELQVRTLAAEAALTVNDVTAAAKLAHELIASQHGAAWKLCAELARHPKLRDDTEGQRRLLGFAALHCPPELLGQLTEELMACERRAGSVGASTSSLRTTAVEERLLHALNLPRALPALLFGAKPLPADLADSGDAAVALQCLLSTKDPVQAEAQLEAVLGGVTSAHTLRPLLALGAYSCLIRVLMAAQPAAAANTAVLEWLYTPLPELMRQAEAAASHSTHSDGGHGEANGKAPPPSTAWLSQARALMTRLQAVGDTEALHELNPEDYVDASRFVLGDKEYQKEAILQAVRSAGSRAVQLDGAAGTSMEAADQLLQKALRMASKYGVAEWDVRFWFLQSVLVCAEQISPQVHEIVVGLGQALCSQPSELLAALYGEVYPLLPSSSTPHIVLFIALLNDCLKALPGEMQRRVALTAPFLHLLGQVLDAAGSKLANISMKHIMTGALQFLLLPMLPSKISHEGPELADALSAMYVYVAPGTVQQLAALLKALRTCVEQALQRRIKDMAKKKALLEQHAAKAVVHESTAYLALACKMLHEAAQQAPSRPARGVAGAGERLRQALDACCEVLRLMLPEHAVRLAAFAVGRAPQPLAEDAVGALQAPAMGPPERLRLLAAVAGVVPAGGAGPLPEDAAALWAALREDRHRLNTAGIIRSLEHLLPKEQVQQLEEAVLSGGADCSGEKVLGQLALLGCPLAPLFSAAHALSETSTSPMIAAAATGDAVQSAADQLLDELASLEDNAPEALVRSNLQRLERLLSGLAATPNDMQQLTSTLRDIIWESMESCLQRLSSRLQASFLELQASFGSGSRWPGWKPSGGWQEQQHGRLLHARSAALLSTHFPAGPAPSPEELASPSTAQLFFAQLLASADQPPQLRCLAQLLRDIWRDGAAWGAPSGPAPLQTAGLGVTADGVGAESVVVSGVHECWSSLLQRMMEAGEELEAVRIVGEYAWPGAGEASGSPVTSEELGALVENERDEGRPLPAACLALTAPFLEHHQTTMALLKVSEPQPGLGGKFDLPLLAALVARERLAELCGAEGGVAAALLQALAACPVHPALAAPGDTQGAALGCLLPSTVVALCSAGRYGTAAALVADRCALHPALAACGGSLQLLGKFLTGAASAPVASQGWDQLPGPSSVIATGLQVACGRALAALQSLTR